MKAIQQVISFKSLRENICRVKKEGENKTKKKQKTKRQKGKKTKRQKDKKTKKQKENTKDRYSDNKSWLIHFGSKSTFTIKRQLGFSPKGNGCILNLRNFSGPLRALEPNGTLQSRQL